MACAEIENWPTDASEAAPRITEVDYELETEKGLAGLLVKPAGRSARATETSPEKPFSEVIETEIGALELPCVIVAGEVDK